MKRVRLILRSWEEHLVKPAFKFVESSLAPDHKHVRRCMLAGDGALAISTNWELPDRA